MTASDNNRVVDHFPMSRASRWKPNPNGALDMLVDTQDQYDATNSRNQNFDNY